MMAKHPAAIAWDDYLASDVGKRATQPYDFTKPGQQVYLLNRLARAFQAGYEAGSERVRGGTRVQQMLAMKSAGMSPVSIAKHFGISRQRVDQLLKPKKVMS